jgi:hypothetical protein
MERIYLAQNKNVGICEHGNEHSDSMKIGNFFTISFSKCIRILVLLLRSVELSKKKEKVPRTLVVRETDSRDI